ARPVPVQYPIGAEDNFQGVVDLIENKSYIWKGDLGEQMEVTDVPDDLAKTVTYLREQMVEAACESDDVLMNKYLNGEALTPDEIRMGLRKATLTLSINPVFCGSAFKKKGVQPMLDGVVDYLP